MDGLDPTQAVNEFLPPGGSIFEGLSGRDGPPMMRLILIQMAYEGLGKKLKL